MSKLNSIKTKLIVVAFLLLTIPMVVLGVISYQKSESSLDELGATNLQNGVEMTIELIDVLNQEVEKGTLSLEEAQEQVKEAILSAMDTDGSREINRNIDLGENGYLFILDQEGVLLAHPDSEGADLWEAADDNGSFFVQDMVNAGNSGGDLTYYLWPSLTDESVIEPKVTYAKTEENWNWVINASTYMKDFNEPAKEILSIVMISIIVTLVIGMVIIWFYINRIATPIEVVTEQMILLAEGDLTQEDVQVTSNDETGKLATALNTMKFNLRRILHNVSQASETMSSRSEELTQASHEVMQGSEQIVSTMQELASGTETGADRTSELSDTMGTFSE